MALRFLSVVGARPQFVKAAVITRALAKAGIEEVMVHTGQHFDREMSEVFFEDLAIPPPQFNLGVSGGSHAEMTADMLRALEPVMAQQHPDFVLVYGDTNSTVAASLCAAKLHYPIAHVEAGLRSFERRMPEEVNRVMTDHLSTVLFCPTQTAVENLSREGIVTDVHHVGDVMFDAALHVASMDQRSVVLEKLGLQPKGYAVATVHRAENTDDHSALEKVCTWLSARAKQQKIVMPIHPRTRNALHRTGLSLSGIDVIDPVGYVDMMQLISNAAFVYTDSGGLQKEAYFYRVPCVTLRQQTEWVETIECGWNRLWSQGDYATPRRDIEDYGKGQAGEQIIQVLLGKAKATNSAAHLKHFVEQRNR